MAGPFKMKAGKEGPMKKNFPSAFKKDTEPTLPVNESDNTRTKNINVPTITPGAIAAANEGMNKSKFNQIVSGSMTNRSLLNNEGKEKYDKGATYDILDYEKEYNKASEKYESAVTESNKNKDKKKSYIDSQTTYERNQLKKDL